MQDTLRQLRDVVSLLQVGGAAGDAVDWQAAAAELRVMSFPSDYREFVSTFGAGSIEESLYVWIPRPETASAALTVGHLPDNALRSESMNVWQESGTGSTCHLEDILVWGQTNGADTLGWVASGPDPERWPVAVWERQGGGWKIHDCGMVQFLLGLLRGEFSECPLSDEALWGVQSARFLNFRNEERFLDRGVDPWTGRLLNRFD
ncbi:hypothetical protein [Streptomyces sp. SID9124]|uniref:hypothetical protein n=1 Tax=Streptomyces sp. SID9124 TaxID=2706108 RepID=UPI0013E0D414|nr:hypothetical protein [Streptomyces sp. SID9124]NED11872.1 hypothetical protein [Streptomyces sp. SID9124]